MIFSSSKCPLPSLVAWCRTLKHSIGAGLDPVKIFKQLTKSGPRQLRPIAKEIQERLSKGDSLEDALEPHRDRFPPLFVELVAIGEKSGRLEETFDELDRYYETTLRVQRDFRSQMAYPAIQFVAAVLIMSGLIFILGMLGTSFDPFSLGLGGTAGAIAFMGIAFGIVGGLLFFLKLSADNVRWRARMEGMALILPGWGPALLNFALHRFCIAMRMTTEAALKMEQVMHYCFRATSNSAFQRGEATAIAVMKKGSEVHEALASCGAPFPEEFLQSILVAEESGRMSEVMERLAGSYQEEASRRLKDAARYTSWAIYGLVCIFIIICIFSVASIYLGAIDNATRGI